jgi:Rieske 2Fe-2S family protein
MTSVIEHPAYFTVLPREYYVSDEVFEREVDRIFLRQWLYAGHLSELSSRGDFRRYDIAGESVVLVRGDGDTVHGFFNVCRHRGYAFCEQQAGNARRFVCPYHRWTYDVDGSLVAAPSLRDGDVIDYADWGLHPVHVGVWHGLVFMCLSREEPEPIADVLERVAPELALAQPERLKVAAEEAYAVEANWKLMLENYLECYHCPGSHPELCVTLDLRQQDIDLQTARSGESEYNNGVPPLKSGTRTLSIDGELVSTRLPVEDGFNAGFSIQPCLSRVMLHADHGVTHTIRPVDTRRLVWTTQWLVHEDAQEGRDYDVERLVKVWDATNREDIGLVEGAYRGVRSRRFQPGPLAPTKEPALRAALATYLRLMGEEGTA